VGRTAGRWLRRATKMAGGRALVAAIVVLLVIGLGCAILVYTTERATNPEMTSIGSGFFWVFATVVDDPPFPVESGASRAAMYALFLVKPGLWSLVTAAIASQLLNLVLKRNAGLGRVKLKDHIVVLGWSGKGTEIVNEIRRRDDADSQAEVVVVAALESNPSPDPLVHFVSGDPTHEADLERASIRDARTAIILADNSYPGIDAEDMDSRTLLATLAVEAINPSCYTCVEVVQSENVPHFKRTSADELVVSGRLTGALLAHSAVTHGLSKIVGDLITFPEENEFYWVNVPHALDGKTFGDALTWFNDHHACIAISLERDGSHVTNPPAAHRIAGGDRVLVIAAEQPRV